MKDQDVGTGGRLEVESGDGGGMDSSVEMAEELIDAKNCIDMGLGVGHHLLHDVEIWGSGADIGQSTSTTSNDDAHETSR